MLPKIAELQFEQQLTQDVLKQGRSFLFDFQKGDFILKDGRLVVASELQALQIWIEKTLRTERFRFKVYEGTNYGVTLEDLIGQTYSYTFTDSEVKREVNESLMKHPQIESISQLSIDRGGSRTKISFNVNLKEGQVFSQGVIFSV